MSDIALIHALILGAYWLAYFAIHSAFASLIVKKWLATQWPRAFPAYRLAYNALAILLLIPPVWIMFNGQRIPVWEFGSWTSWLTNGLAIVAIIGFLYTLRYYDGQEFSGVKQLKDPQQQVEDQEHFQLSPFHQYVRHPWYFLALVIIWTRDMDSLMLITAILMTAYFIIGSRLEETRLKRYHGDFYRKYQNKVPGLIPLPWKFMTKQERLQLLNEYQATQGR